LGREAAMFPSFSVAVAEISHYSLYSGLYSELATPYIGGRE